jgi:dephospho-CoA kinase
MNIALIGGMGSGKTTILSQLVQHHGFVRMSWADPVKEIARWAYGHVEKNALYEVRSKTKAIKSGREILQQIGTDALRDQVDEDFWIRCGLNRMAASEDNLNWVNDDSRFPNEIEALRQRDFKVVRLWVPDHVRAERLGITRDQLTKLSQHASESQIAGLHSDVTAANVGTPEEVTKAIMDWLMVESWETEELQPIRTERKLDAITSAG